MNLWPLNGARSIELSYEDKTTHGCWTTPHNDGIQNFGLNFNFRSKHKCVLKQT
jgi:hypothetical protein